ncbi:MAG TPA: hypothetical protein VKP67_00375 [Xanthobacteraceae bacterium]|nr:hypothetical protein [Xanthobacteraceae bacterium]
MSEAERDQMRTKLDEFSRRLDAVTREFRERGELSDPHQSLISQIQGRRERMQDKLACAEAKGSGWEIIKIELERDFSSIYDDVLRLNEELDADEMKQEQK